MMTNSGNCNHAPGTGAKCNAPAVGGHVGKTPPGPVGAAGAPASGSGSGPAPFTKSK